jgi:8-oxo-dGTP diphosphatase
MSRGETPTIVVAAVIRDVHGKVLLTRRPEGAHMGGLWEFPGGKVEPGESPTAALGRELGEELGLVAEIGEPLTFAVHEEPGMRILLLFYAAVVVSGRPEALEGQEIAWVAAADLDSYPTPPADRGLVRRLMDGSRVDRGPGRGLP